MKNVIKIIVVCLPFLLINSCGEKHEQGDGHNHGAESSSSEDHEEAVATVTSLTQEQIKAVGITLGTVEYKQLTASIKANGALRVPNNNKGNATSLYGGVVKTLTVQIGDHVKKGQVVATIANPQFIQLQEEYLTIDSRITLAEQEMQRQKELSEGNAGAKKNLQSATAELSTLRTRKASLQQQIQLMGINPNTVSNSNLRSALTVTSPISGTVSNVFAKIGSYVDVAFPVIEVVDNSSLHLDLQVFEKDLPKIKVGQVIHFTLTNNPEKEYDATVFSIGSSFENESKSIAVHAKVSGTPSGLIDGMNITGIVSLDNVKSPAVPNEAIVEADGNYYIFIQTDKEAQEHQEEGGHDDHGHAHDEGEEGHNHANEAEAGKHANEQQKMINFEKIEVIKGVSDLGYTAVTFITEFPANAKVVTKGAFFINAKLSNTGGHQH